MKNEEKKEVNEINELYMDFAASLYTCKMCHGEGGADWDNRWIMCTACNGSGEVDWVQHATGK